MTVLEILKFPDERLRQTSVDVTDFNPDLSELVRNMYDTMYQTSGIGLAAPQVNIHKNIIIVDISKTKNQPLCLINPKIKHQSGEVKMPDRCLSIPGITGTVKRPEKISLTALNETGETIEIEANDVLAAVIDHELEHLKGILFVDHLLN